MAPTITALKTLYVALGGSAADVANIVKTDEMINAIATVAATAVAAELPKVTSSNNGSVLKVVNGKWAIGTDAVS